MCGRYVLFTPKEQLIATVKEATGVERVEDVSTQIGAESIYRQSYNIAPTHHVPIVRVFREGLALGPARWGYPRAGARSNNCGVVFNARGETANEKYIFRGSARCLFVMDGWYEWTQHNGSKQPWFTSRADHRPLLVAGLCRPCEGDVCGTIITCPAIDSLQWLHHRMPRILNDEEARAWLGASDETAHELAGSVVASTMHRVVSRKASKAVGNVRNNSSALIASDSALHSGIHPE
ncbi:SOS response-associated peptidase [Corynebacterium sp. 4HC-13]|uniref:SOS response-associated peptidase n=1 Tax=Corynebacterium anserum TaxID=2684406 RepID=UPI00163AE406|nr:SOS response-associated peptidase [Corynebacterium anserum]MBC2682088.1 SOS response-associated peptidase [Corynebacterium anserum]